MKWFKHYNQASQGDTLREFFSQHDYECIALFWVLLEYMSRTEIVSDRGSASISYSLLAKDMNMKPSKIRRVLSRFSLVSRSWNFNETGEILSFRIPNWQELQESRGGKRDAKNEQKPGRSKKEEVRTKIQEQKSGNSISNFEASFDQRWLEFEAALSPVLLPIHLKKLGYYKPEILRQFSAVDEMRAFINPHVEGYRRATKDAVSDMAISNSVYKLIVKLATDFDEREQASA